MARLKFEYIPVEDIAYRVGARSDSKVKQMRRSLRNGGSLPPIRVALVDESLQQKLRRMGIGTEGKRYYLLEGHHRYRATVLEKKSMIPAKIVRKFY